MNTQPTAPPVGRARQRDQPTTLAVRKLHITVNFGSDLIRMGSGVAEVRTINCRIAKGLLDHLIGWSDVLAHDKLMSVSPGSISS
jgi:hypothetical protein